MRFLTPCASLVLLVSTAVLGCDDKLFVGNDDGGTSDGGPGDGGNDAGHSCTTSANCGANELCGFAKADACSAKGQCFASPGAVCLAYSAGCACDGSEINIACNGLPDGYETKPLAHAGECTTDAAIDGGNDAPQVTSCVTNADCSANQVCGFDEADACSAKGQCFTAPGAICNLVELGCACDGSEINIATCATGLPTGYAPDPLAHTGSCTTEAGLDAPASTDAPPILTCTTTADCGANQVCGFDQADACSAKGQCFKAPGGAACALYEAGCACDGSEINIATCATGLPTGYAPDPLAHTGACEADAAADACVDLCDATKTCPSSQSCCSPLPGTKGGCTYCGDVCPQ